MADTVSHIDRLSQEGFSAIESYADQVSALIRGDGTQPVSGILAEINAYMFAIVDKALEMGGAINVKAEEVGCNYVYERV